MSDAVGAATRQVLDAGLSRERADREDFAPAVWAEIRTAGLDLIGLPELLGGAGGDWSDAWAAVSAAASRPCAVPLAESLFGVVPALVALQLPAPGGTVAAASFGAGAAVDAARSGSGVVLTGRVGRVPFARYAEHVVVPARYGRDHLLALCRRDGPGCVPGTNVAGEARDDLVLDAVVPVHAAVLPAGEHDRWIRLAALGRSVQIAAATAAAADLATRYARERMQFGRPIARFQAVAHHLAVLAGEAAVTGAAVTGAVDALGGPHEAWAIACAKARAGRSAGTVARTAHQVLGAIGFTREHALHRLTRRLWSWRDEAGAARHWEGVVGGVALAATPGLWALLTVQDR